MPPNTPTEPLLPEYTPGQPPVYPQPVGTSPAVEDPGKTMGILGFVLAFFIAPVGLILSILGYKKSKQAGIGNGLALAGIILGALGTVLTLLIVALIAASYSSTQERTKAVNGQSAANEVIRRSVEYYTSGDSGDYPKTFSELSMVHDLRAVQSTVKMTAAPKDPTTVEFYACEDGNKVGYWNYVDKKVTYLFVGETTESSNCTLATS